MKKLTFEEWLYQIPSITDILHDYFNDSEKEARKDYENYLANEEDEKVV